MLVSVRTSAVHNSRAFRLQLGRSFTSGTVDGFTGAVGNTPLVSLGYKRLYALVTLVLHLVYSRRKGTRGCGRSEWLMPVVLLDLSQEVVRKDWIYDLWKSRIPESWWECQRSCSPGDSQGCRGFREVRSYVLYGIFLLFEELTR